MLARIDHFILKRVYQPLANLAMRRVGRSCYWLAAHSALGASALFVVFFASCLVRADPGPVGAITLVSIMIAAAEGRAQWNAAVRAERRRAASDLATLDPLSRCAKVWLPTVLLLSWTLAFGAVFALWMAAALGRVSFAYFMECAPAAPQKRRRSVSFFKPQPEGSVR
jgi:hypothetical protein